jgi:DNA invertase Pin-like site-specific DNA recombinase
MFLPPFHNSWTIVGIMKTTIPKATKTQTTCLIYARCSTRDQETENQLAQLRDYAHKQNWQVSEEIVDVCSGGKASKDRLGLDKVFQLAHRKAFDVLLFWALDRFSREGSRKTIAYLTILDDYGVAWHSYTEQYLSSLGVFKDCIISLLSTLAKQEKIRISERTKAGMDRTRKNGTRLGRPKTPTETLRKALKLRKEGLSFSEIGKRLGVKRTRAFQLVQAAAS